MLCLHTSGRFWVARKTIWAAINYITDSPYKLWIEPQNITFDNAFCSGTYHCYYEIPILPHDLFLLTLLPLSVDEYDLRGVDWETTQVD